MKTPCAWMNKYPFINSAADSCLTMTATVKTLLALDIDGVINAFNRTQRGLIQRQIGPWLVAWRPSALRELKKLLREPDVTGVWLSRWLDYPEHLDELSKALGLEKLVTMRAEHPKIAWIEREAVAIRDGRFPRASVLEPRSGYWWKFRSVELLMKSHSGSRLIWLDDELGHSSHALKWAPASTGDRLLYRVHPGRGLMPADVRKIRAWHQDGEKP